MMQLTGCNHARHWQPKTSSRQINKNTKPHTVYTQPQHNILEMVQLPLNPLPPPPPPRGIRFPTTRRKIAGHKVHCTVPVHSLSPFSNLNSRTSRYRYYRAVQTCADNRELTVFDTWQITNIRGKICVSIKVHATRES